ncbi:MAG: hypothetical protein JST10_05465 [Bacteroidetes bacterium]|nr:hypothetical protein [Bacteroidota bacterium]
MDEASQNILVVYRLPRQFYKDRGIDFYSANEKGMSLNGKTIGISIAMA